MGVSFDGLDPEADLRLLERVASLIVPERLGVFGSILERFAEREAEVITILGSSGRRLLFGAHSCDVFQGKSIGLEVRETPVRIAEAPPTRNGRLIGVDRVLFFAERLQSVHDRE